MSVQVSTSGFLTGKQQLKLLTMNATKRKRLNGQIGRKVRTASRKRLKLNRNIDGTSWQARKSQGRKKKRRMMRKLGRNMVTYYSADKATVTFKNAGIGRTAYAHQHGVSQYWTAEKSQKLYGTPDYQAQATRRQAKALREAGYKRPRSNGKGYVKATIKWITENLKLGQAGLILRILRDETQTKKSWVIELPERDFLGVNNKELKDIVQHVFAQATKLEA